MSDTNLEQLIASLKTEAIESAGAEADKVLADAKAKAEAIIENAKKEKESILTAANKEAEGIVEKGKVVLQQAARDLTLAVQSDILSLFRAALENEIKSELEAGTLKAVILAIIESMGKGTRINLSTGTYKKLADFIQNQVKSSDGIKISEDNSVLQGMKITKTGEGWSYEITSETITESLLPYLTGNWVNILKGGEKS